MMPATQLWFRAFLLTVTIEAPLVVGLTRRNGLSWQRSAGLALLAQVMTHPLVWYVFPMIPGMTRSTAFVVSELWAWLAEFAFYAVTGVAPSALRAVAVSSLANGASLAAGLMLL